MSVTTTRKERGAKPETEVWVQMLKIMGFILGRLPEEDRNDLMEVLLVMGQSEEEMAEGEETIREILTPKVGTLFPVLPADPRDPKVDKWARFAGARVRGLRKRANITQEALAKATGLPQPHISRIENGEISPTRHTLEKIAKAFQVSVADLDPTDPT